MARADSSTPAAAPSSSPKYSQSVSSATVLKEIKEEKASNKLDSKRKAEENIKQEETPSIKTDSPKNSGVGGGELALKAPKEKGVRIYDEDDIEAGNSGLSSSNRPRRDSDSYRKEAVSSRVDNPKNEGRNRQ